MKKNSNSYFYIATTIIIAIYFISFYSKITEGFIISKNVYVFYHICMYTRYTKHNNNQESI